MATAKNEIPKIYHVNLETGEEVLRDMTEDELAYNQVIAQQVEANRAAEAAQIAARTSALAKLKELGLTEAEIAAL